MKSTITMAFLAGLLLCPSVARAEDDLFRPAPNGTYTLDLDTRSGAASSWMVGDLSGVDAVRAEFRVRLLSADPRWAPAYGLEVGGKGDGVRVQIVSVDRKTLQLFVLHQKGSGEWEQAPDAEIAVDQPVAVAFDWTDAGVVTVVVRPKGGAVIRREFRLSAAPVDVEVSSSTGELMIDTLRLGTTRPQP